METPFPYSIDEYLDKVKHDERSYFMKIVLIAADIISIAVCTGIIVFLIREWRKRK